MTADPPALSCDGTSFLLRVKVRPAARRDCIRGIVGGLVRIDVAAVAEGGRATVRLLEFVAERFGVAPARVELLSGAHTRWKRLKVEGGTLPPELAEAAPFRR